MGRPQFTLEEVKEICLSFGWKLISNQYVNARGKLEIECPEGHRCFKSIEKIKAGRGCKKCNGINQRNEYELVRQKFSEIGFTLLTDDYKGAHIKMPVICCNGHYGLKTFNSVQKGRRCRQCTYEDMTGEGNANYKELSETQRIRQRAIGGEVIW